MKKFNTILAIATVALTSIFGFTSCEKNDDAFKQPETQVAKSSQVQTQKSQTVCSTFEYNLFINDEILNLGDVVVSLEQDGHTTEYKASEAQTTTKVAKEEINGSIVETTIYGKMIVIKGIKPGAVINPSFHGNTDALASLPKDGKTDLAIFTYYIKNLHNNKSSQKSSELYVYNPKNDTVESCINARMKAGIHSFE